jgi:hypothetical protein
MVPDLNAAKTVSYIYIITEWSNTLKERTRTKLLKRLTTKSGQM